MSLPDCCRQEGRKIETLVKEELKPGTYRIDRSASGGKVNYPSGIYFYRLSAETFTETKKMLLIK